MPHEFERELELARRAATESGQLAIGLRGDAIAAEDKSDDSPVTAADRACEKHIVSLIEEHFPEDGILGEEGAGKESRSGRRWIIDPIDGTRDFIRGNRLWACLIALEADGEVVLGIANLPAQGELYWAVKGKGAWLGETRLGISKGITARSRAVMCLNGYQNVPQYEFAGRLTDWLAGFWAVRGLGGCVDCLMVASGKAEAWIEPNGKAWDFAPLKVIAEEAGAVFRSFDGGSGVYAGNAYVCVPALEDEVRGFVAGGKKK